MQINLDGKVFRSLHNTANGEVDAETRFHYRQQGDVISAEYAGGQILRGQLLGRMLADGRLEFAYHHLNHKGELMIGRCVTELQLLADGRLLGRESWTWLSGDHSSGHSGIVEVVGDDPLKDVPPAA